MAIKINRDFSPMQLKIILEDQECALRSLHVSYFKNCPDLSRCPRDHFSGISFAEIQWRQEIIRKLEAIANGLPM